MKDRPLVSIIIPTYNSQATLRRCLESIKNQTYENIEVILVDGGSKDKTSEIASAYPIKFYTVAKRGMTRQTNYGVKMASGKYIYRVDHDVVLDPTIVEEAAAKCEDEHYDVVCIFWCPDPTISFWAKVRKLEKDCYKGELLSTGMGARFMRKEVFEAIGGFQENLTFGEDLDLYNRLKKATFKIGEIEAQELHIGEPKRLVDFARKQYFYGLTIKDFLQANPKVGVIQVSPMRLQLVKNWKKFARHPVLAFGFLVYYVTQYASALAGLTASYIRKQGNR